MELKGYFTLPTSGVMILLNLETNSVWVNYSENIPLALSRVYPELAGQPIQVKLESVGADLETLKLHSSFYREWYNARGFTTLIPYGKDGVTYRTRIYPDRFSGVIEFDLVTARGAARHVSRFRTIAEAKAFIRDYYNPAVNAINMPVINIKDRAARES